MENQSSQWSAIRRIADEIQVQLHLASLELRDRWHALEPRIEHLSKLVDHAGKRAGRAIDDEVAALSAALEKLRDDLTAPDDR